MANERFVTDWLARKDISKLDGIFQAQWPYVCDRRQRLLVDHVGRFENLEPTLDFVRAKLGREPELELSNSSGETVDYRDFYTRPLIELVGRIYAADLERFGYEF